MNWIMEPLSGYDVLSTIFSDTCATVYCSCTSGLLYCAKEGALKADQKPE